MTKSIMERMEIVMSRSSNILTVHDWGIKFNGFDLVNKIATICFYPSSIVVMPKEPDAKLDCHYIVQLDSDKSIHDVNLVLMLEERGITESVNFIENNNVYYDIDMHGM